MSADGDERRLHELSWLFETARAARSLVLPWAVLLFASGGVGYEIWATLFVVPAGFAAALKYLFFRYRLDCDEMVVRDGIFTRTERHIPFARIQNIDLVRNPVHRLLRVALVRVETASGGAPEAVMRVLSLDAVEEMRSRVFAPRPVADATVATASRDAGEAGAPPVGADDRRVLLHLGLAELARLGVVSNKGIVVIGAALGLLWQTDWWDRDWTDGWESSAAFGREWWGTLAAGSPVAAAVVMSLVVLPLAWLLLRVISIGWYAIQLHDFTLSRSGDDLRAEYGLFNKISRTVPTPRIQVLTTREGPLHRLFGRQTVELQTVGASGIGEMDTDDAGAKVESQWLAPMIERGRVPALLRAVDAEVDLESIRWEPLSPGATRRKFKRWTTIVVAVAVPVAAFLDPWVVALAVPLVALGYVNARLYARHTGYAMTSWAVLFRTGWWDRTLKIVRYSKIQAVGQAESPFDRRYGMASVLVDTAGAEMIAHTINIPYLDLEAAAAVSGRLYDEASSRSFKW